MFNCAIVGCGGIGKGHARAMKECRELRLVAGVDPCPEAAEAFAKEFGVPVLARLEEALARSDIEFLDICTPSGLHGDIAIAAAGAGKHCISEKPLDTTPQRCDEILAAFRKARTTLGGVFQHRFADHVRKTREALDAGRFGRLTLITCSTPWWRPQTYYDSGTWRGTWKLDGGGALMNQGIHAIDLALWFGGPVNRITAMTALLAHERIEVEDAAVAVCQFASGAIGVIVATTAAYPGGAVRHEVMGTDGMAVLDNDVLQRRTLRDEEKTEAKPAAAAQVVQTSSPPHDLPTNLFTRNLDDIARAAREGHEPCVSGTEARRAVEIVCAIYESARTHTEVELPLKEFHP